MPGRFRGTVFISTALMIFGIVGGDTRADLIKLNNGGEVRGKIQRNPGGTDDDLVTLETLSGAIVVVERKNIQFVTRRSLKVEQYESLAKETPNTVSDRERLAEWCRTNGLTKQRAEQLNLILQLDPDHEKAHRGLGHSNRGGKWMTRDAAMTAQGYVKHKGRYVTRQELELIQKSQAERDAEQKWFKKIRRWHGWLTGRDFDRQKLGLDELKQIQDPDAVSALLRLMQDDRNKQIRELYIQILAQIKGDKPVAPLVTQYLRDSDWKLRFAALDAISPDQYAAAVPLFVKALKNDLNVIIRRAATALARVGGESVVPKLIEALVTTHTYKVQIVDNSTSYSFGTDGSFGSAGNQSVLPPEIELQLRTGQLPNGVIVNRQRLPGLKPRTKTVTVKHTHQNTEVLTALKKLTDENFRYEERTWRRWWNAKKNGLGSNVPVVP